MAHNKSEKFIATLTGMSDGFIIPFAVVSGMSFAATGQFYIVTIGMIVVLVGSIAMGLAGFFTSKEDEAKHYHFEEVETDGHLQHHTGNVSPPDFEYKNILSSDKATGNAVYISLGYCIAGTVPVLPYLLIDTLPVAVTYSVVLTMTALAATTFLKARLTGQGVFSGLLLALLRGIIILAAAYFVATIFM